MSDPRSVYLDHPAATLMSPHSFRPFSSKYRTTCLALFDANCPEFFEPNERADLEAFLDGELMA